MFKKELKRFQPTSAVGVVGFAGALVSGLATTLIVTGSAAGIFAVVKSMLSTVLTSVQGISTILACVCIAICALILIFTKDQKASDGALSWLKRIILAVVLINAAGSVLTYLISALSKAGAEKTKG